MINSEEVIQWHKVKAEEAEDERKFVIVKNADLKERSSL
jgi:hypothetical protein